MESKFSCSACNKITLSFDILKKNVCSSGGVPVGRGVLNEISARNTGTEFRSVPAELSSVPPGTFSREIPLNSSEFRSGGMENLKIDLRPILVGTLRYPYMYGHLVCIHVMNSM